MKKIATLLAVVGLGMAAQASAAKSNPNIEAVDQFDCKTGGCELICTTETAKVVKKAKSVKEGTVTYFKSGTVKYDMKVNFEKVNVTVPSGTVSCVLTNVEL